MSVYPGMVILGRVIAEPCLSRHGHARTRLRFSNWREYRESGRVHGPVEVHGYGFLSVAVVSMFDRLGRRCETGSAPGEPVVADCTTRSGLWEILGWRERCCEKEAGKET